jgi:hypothetical protein
MPPAVAAAGIAAAGSLGGALIGRSGQNRALQSQERATNAQIQLERERDAARQQRYAASMENYNRENAEYNQMRRALLAHYGVNFGDTGAAPSGGGGGAQGGMGAGGGYDVTMGNPGGGISLGALMQGQATGGGGPAGPTPAPPPGDPAGAKGTLGDMMEGGDAFDWRNYGVR